MIERIAEQLQTCGVLSRTACQAESDLAFAASFTSEPANVLRMEVFLPRGSRPIATAKMAADPEARRCLASAWRVLSELRRALPSCIVATLEPALAMIEEDGRCLLLSESRQGSSVLARTQALSARAATRRLHDDLSLFADWLAQFQASSASPARSSLAATPVQAASRPRTTADADDHTARVPARADTPSHIERTCTQDQVFMCAGHGALELNSLHVADARPRVYDWEFSSLRTHVFWDWYALWFSFAGRLRQLGSTPPECRELLGAMRKHHTDALTSETTRTWLGRFLEEMASRGEAAPFGQQGRVWERRLRRYRAPREANGGDVLIEVLADG